MTFRPTNELLNNDECGGDGARALPPAARRVMRVHRLPSLALVALAALACAQG